MKTFFKKLEHRFLAERTKIEKASFPYKTASMDACPPVGPVYIPDWKLRLATLRSGDWLLWFIETFRSPPIRSVAFGTPGHLDVSM